MRPRDARVGVRPDDRARTGAHRGDVPDAQRAAVACSGATTSSCSTSPPTRPRPPTPRRAARVAEALRVAAARGRCARARCSRFSTAPRRCARSTPDFGALSRLPTTIGITAAGADEPRPVDFVAALLRADLRRQRGSGHRIGVLHAGALLGRAARQAGDARASGEPPRRRAVLRARRRSRAHRRQGAPRITGTTRVLRAGDGRLPLLVLRQAAWRGAQADFGSARLHLQRMRRAVSADPRPAADHRRRRRRSPNARPRTCRRRRFPRTRT